MIKTTCEEGLLSDLGVKKPEAIKQMDEKPTTLTCRCLPTA